MRTIVVLMTGFALLVAGILVLALTGATLLGVGLLVLGVLLKVGCLLLGDDPVRGGGAVAGPRSTAGRTGRAADRAHPAPARGVTVRARRAARSAASARSAADHGRRRAS